MSGRVNPASVSGTIGALNAAVGPYRYRSTDQYKSSTLRISVMGTFVGTITVEVCDPDATPNVAGQFGAPKTYTSGGQSDVFEPGGNCDVYLVFTAYTSGSAVCSIYG